ncbi:hypothetical protein C0J52_07304 [Blattella germanica]|nr:hypothetical protein C0J52_07304 [Blattella germanica]
MTIHRSHLKTPVRQFKWLLILNQKGVEIFWYLLIREQDDTERMIVEVGGKKVKEAQRRKNTQVIIRLQNITQHYEPNEKSSDDPNKRFNNL